MWRTVHCPLSCIGPRRLSPPFSLSAPAFIQRTDCTRNQSFLNTSSTVRATRVYHLMTSTDLWDEHYFALTAVVTVGLQLACFFVAFYCHFDLITDFAGSMNKVLLVIMTLCLKNVFYTRQVILTALLVLSRTELACLLFYRVCSRKKDDRFDELHKSFCSYLGFWVFQMVWVYATSAPVIFVTGDLANPPIGTFDVVGWVLFAVGFLSQVVSDLQKMAFRKNPANKKTDICRVGLWRFSRHPNYFGEICIWLGLFMASTAVFDASTSSPGWGWATVVSPVFTIWLLLFFSGIPTAEGKNLKRFYVAEDQGAAWEQYARVTSPLIPFPPSLYENLSPMVKKIFFFEFDRYRHEVESFSEAIRSHSNEGYSGESTQK